MSKYYIGLDVDDKHFNFTIFSPESGEMINGRCKANVSKFLEKLKKLNILKQEIKVCYESSYVGFSLCRELLKNGVHTEVIASSLIPETKGRKVKTDRLDSEKLALYYAKDLLTAINIPDKEDEEVKSLLRSRHFLNNQLKSIKKHIIGLCRLNGLDYKLEKGSGVKHWTLKHRQWLSVKTNSIIDGGLKFNLENLYFSIERLEESIFRYDEEIKQIALIERYVKQVKALKSYRGIQDLTALTLSAEIGDIRRFSHPSRLVSYIGLDITEYSSGGKESKFSISKMGNSIIRKVLVEANQPSIKKPMISRRLKKDRQEVNTEVVKIADKCMSRLYKKATNLRTKDKHINKVKVAVTREKVGFIWETLNFVSNNPNKILTGKVEST